MGWAGLAPGGTCHPWKWADHAAFRPCVEVRPGPPRPTVLLPVPCDWREADWGPRTRAVEGLAFRQGSLAAASWSPAEVGTQGQVRVLQLRGTHTPATRAGGVLSRLVAGRAGWGQAWLRPRHVSWTLWLAATAIGAPFPSLWGGLRGDHGRQEWDPPAPLPREGPTCRACSASAP